MSFIRASVHDIFSTIGRNILGDNNVAARGCVIKVDFGAVLWEKVSGGVCPFYDNDILRIAEGFGEVFEHEPRVF